MKGNPQPLPKYEATGAAKPSTAYHHPTCTALCCRSAWGCAMPDKIGATLRRLCWLLRSCFARQALPYWVGAVPHRLRCLLQVSVGRLGVITRVTLRVVPHGLIKRTRVDLSPETFAEHLLALEAKHVSALAAGDAGGVAHVTRQLEGTNVSRRCIGMMALRCACMGSAARGQCSGARGSRM